MNFNENLNIIELFKNAKYEPKQSNDKYKYKIDYLSHEKFKDSPVNINAVKNKFMRDKFNDFDYKYDNSNYYTPTHNLKSKKDLNLFWQQLNQMDTGNNKNKINYNYFPLKDNKSFNKQIYDYNNTNIKVNHGQSPYNHKEYSPNKKDFYYVKDELNKYADATLMYDKLIRKDHQKNNNNKKS